MANKSLGCFKDKTYRAFFKRFCMSIELDLFYTLDAENNTIPCTLHEWGQMYHTIEGQQRRKVAFDDIGEIQVSTVFLGLDHNHFGGRPLLFETMVFNGNGNDIYCERYSTWKEAEEGHKTALEWVNNGCPDEEE